ncbi:hypothetical protein KIW84_054610 [Lathyrus oleraceus]|uniref:Transmembrane protein n=1 Tax=Pisum sativum TaxID=3888 RepID=A0A9D5AII0_PEA|nr:hypothetical protein KIW84_054610 [Pisum sativum]
MTEILPKSTKLSLSVRCSESVGAYRPSFAVWDVPSKLSFYPWPSSAIHNSSYVSPTCTGSIAFLEIALRTGTAGALKVNGGWKVSAIVVLALEVVTRVGVGERCSSLRKRRTVVVTTIADLTFPTTMIMFHFTGVVGCETLLWILLPEFWKWYIINLFLLLVTSFCFFKSIASSFTKLLLPAHSNAATAQPPTLEPQESQP